MSAILRQTGQLLATMLQLFVMLYGKTDVNKLVSLN